MLLNITVENFRSYNEAQTLSLIASKNNGINSVSIGEFEIRKSSIIYGANASGKSNIIKAINTLIDILNYDISQPNSFLGKKVYHPFFNSVAPTLISIDFSVDKNIYTYSIKYDDKNIYLEELLNEDGKPIFSRYFLDSKYSYDVPRPELILSSEQIASGLLTQIKLSTSEKRTFLRQLVDQYNGKQLQPILQSIRNILIRLNPYDTMGKPNYAMSDLNFAVNYFKEMNMKESIVESLNSIGANFQDLQVTYNDENPMPGDISGGVRKISSKYIIDGKECELDFKSDESDGTVKFYSYLALLDLIIQNDGVLIIDELETNFHPLLVEEIIRTIHHSNSKAQLIFTTHNPALLDESLFEIDQIYFATKNNNNQATELYSLADFTDLKSDDNLQAKYLTGKFGAIPFMPSLPMRDKKNEE